MKAYEILEKAREEIIERGFNRGSLSNASGNVCALGAVRAAAYGDPSAIITDYELYDPVRDAIKALIEATPSGYKHDLRFGYGSAVAMYNDYRIENEKQCLAWFAEAARYAKEEEMDY